MNRVVLVGRLVRDVELRYTQSGTAVASFSIAVGRRRKKDSNEAETDFINAVIWSKAAENFANFTSKGSRVAIDGRLQTSNYQNQQGQTVYKTEVIVENFDLLETRAESEERRGQQGNQPMNSGNVFGAPANNQGGTSAGNFNPPSNFGNGKEIEIADDDLPF